MTDSDDDPDDGLPRRRLLQAGGAAGAVVALAGCYVVVDELTDGGLPAFGYGDTSTPTGDGGHGYGEQGYGEYGYGGTVP